MSTEEFDEQTVRKFYQLLAHESETEVRMFPNKLPESHFVYSEDEFVELCKRYNSKCNIYAGINERCARGKKDKHVRKLRLFYFDIDPLREKGTSATEEQKGRALRLTKEMVRELRRRNYHQITVGDSGNGYHIYLSFREIHVTAGNWKRIKEKYKGFGDKIRKRFHGKYNCNVDPVFNLSRISKVIGTQSVKGKTHRLSKFLRFEAKANEGLREDILLTAPSTRIQPTKSETRREKVQPKNGKRFKELLKRDDKLRKLYEGEWSDYPSRSEAEQALACKLVWYELPEQQIKQIMNNAKLGKWQEAHSQYRELTLRKAREKYVRKTMSMSKGRIPLDTGRGVCECIDQGVMKYELLPSEDTPKPISGSHICKDFVLQPIFRYVRKTVKIPDKRTKKGYREECVEDFLPLALYECEEQRGYHPMGKDFVLGGKRYRIGSKPQPLDTMMAPHAVDRFLAGEKVDGKKLWTKVKEYVERYLDLRDKEKYICYTAWLLATYFASAYPAFPYIHFYGVHRSGKSRAQQVGTLLAYHGTYAKGISTPALFRLIEATGATMFIDEAEKLYHPKADPEKQLILNAGYQKGGRAYRINKNSMRLEGFNVYSPKSLSSIHQLYYVLRSRAIGIQMEPTETKKGNLMLDQKEARELRNALYILRLQDGAHLATLASQEFKVFEELELTNRERELFLPLLHITATYGSREELQHLKNFVRGYVEAERNEYIDSPEATVLSALRDILGERAEDSFVPIKDIRHKIILQDPDAYTVVNDDYGEERIKIIKTSETAKKYTPTRIGYILRNLGFTRKKRTVGGVCRFIVAKHVDELVGKLGLAGAV